MTRRKAYVVGAGLAGLSAAVRLSAAGRDVRLYESAPQAGGRCRSYFDKTLGLTIDNGNHLVLSGNRETMAFLGLVGAADRLTGPGRAEFSFLDLATMERWTLRINDGRLPWWLLSPSRRMPGTRAQDYLGLARLMVARAGATIGETIATAGPVYDRMLRPILVSALNSEPRTASAALAGAIMRGSLAKGGAACRPLVAAKNLTETFVAPALAYVSAKGGAFHAGRRVTAIGCEDGRAASIAIGGERVELAPDDAVVIAVPPAAAVDLLQGLDAPSSFNAIVNGHFAMRPPPGAPPILALLNASAEWIFSAGDRISVTVSDAGALLAEPHEDLARLLWTDVAKALSLPSELPPWRIIVEKRATFAATPDQNRRRPPARTRWRNLTLAGDWTQTGLPATIEGAIGSGRAAAEALGR